MHPVTSGLLAIFKDKRILVPGLLVIPGLVLFSLIPVLIASRGSLPLRTLNNLINLCCLCLLALIFMAGAANVKVAKVLDAVRVPSWVPLLILICGLLANDSFLEAWKSTLSGYFYHSIAEDRAGLMRTAVKEHRRSITIKPNEELIQNKIRQVFPNGGFKTINNLLLEKPSILYYDNQLAIRDLTYLKYYGMDSIIVEK